MKGGNWRVSRWEAGREECGEKKRGGLGGGERVLLFLPTLTSCCQIVILPFLQAAGNGVWYPLEKPNGHCQLLQVVLVEKMEKTANAGFTQDCGNRSLINVARETFVQKEPL